MGSEFERPIALFVPSMGGGGAQRVVVNLANALVESVDRPVHVVLASKTGPMLMALRPEVVVHDLKVTRVAFSILRLAQYIRANRPVVLMATLDYANVASVLARLLAFTSCRLVIREANILAPPSGSFIRRARARILLQLMRWLYPQADALVANSQDTLDSLAAAGVQCRSAVVIGNPVTVDASMHTPMQCAFLDGRRFICAIGRLVPQKGFDVLLDAFARVAHKDHHLVILGEGGLRKELVEQAESLGVADRVHLPGFLTNASEVLAQAELFVLSSRWEGFGNVLVEALALGVPVVSTDCPGGPRTILADGQYGRLVPVDDPVALATAIDECIEQPVATKGERVDRAQDFSARSIAQQYLDSVLVPSGSN